MNDPLDIANMAQARAADPNASVFVTANAGSGKTKVLVDRIARLLLLPDAKPSAFLCITYTKAAANEMQRRLFERLGQWCVAKDEDLARDLAKLAGPSAPAPSPAHLTRARALFAAALETPGGLKIQTIHAFCERLLARFPLEAGVAPGFEIVDDARAAELKQRARAQAVLQGAPDVRAAFERFAERLHLDALEELLDRLADSAPQLVADPEKIKSRHLVSAGREQTLRDFFAHAPWSDLNAAIGKLEASTSANQGLAAAIREARAKCNADASDAFESYCHIFLTAAFEPRKREPTAKLRAAEPFIDRLFSLEGETGRVCATREKLNAIDRAEDAIAALKLAGSIGKNYDHAKAQSGLLDFADLIAHAHALLSRADAAPWVLYKLDGGIEHILVDEGQDTSPAQWDLIAPLQDEFFAGLGAREKNRTVFAVGDPKQSIYAFQGADPERFLAESQNLSKRAAASGAKFSAPALETSFRSAPEILRVVDAVFEHRPLAAGAIESQNIARHLASRANEHGLVEVWPLAPRPERKSAEAWDAPLDSETETSAQGLLASALARCIKEWIEAGEAVWENGVLRPMHAGDVLVLVKKRGPLFRELIRAFKRAGLPVAGADRMVLREELAVEDCLALIRLALDPKDDYALACVLKSPWLNLIDDDADIFPLAYDRSGALIDALNASEDQKYNPARAFVADAISRAHTTPFEFLNWALERRDDNGVSGWRRMLARLGHEAREPLEELLARALSPGAIAAPTLQRFLYEVENDETAIKREMEAQNANLRVMTVHGAKGLEAPVVILPDAAGPVSDKPDQGLVIDEQGPFVMESAKTDDAVTAGARQRHAERALFEHRRLLYVALTRARDRLIICAPQSGNSKSGEAEHGWRAAVEEALQSIGEPCDTPFGKGWRLGAPQQAPARDRQPHTVTDLPAWAYQSRDYSRDTASAAPSRAKRLDPAVFSPLGDGLRRFRRGRLIHGLLQRLPDVAVERRESAALDWLKRQGADEKESKGFATEALRVINDPRFAEAFGAQSRPEAPIIGAAGDRVVRGIVDRLAVLNDSVLVVDYKTDRPAPERAEDAPASYVLQMALYREVLRQIFPHKPVRCALIWTEAPHLVELSETQLDAQLSAYDPG